MSAAPPGPATVHPRWPIRMCGTAATGGRAIVADCGCILALDQRARAAGNQVIASRRPLRVPGGRGRGLPPAVFERAQAKDQFI